jgi:hypothetical protein
MTTTAVSHPLDPIAVRHVDDTLPNREAWGWSSISQLFPAA